MDIVCKCVYVSQISKLVEGMEDVSKSLF